MGTITYTDNSTLIPAAWLNDVNTVVYTYFGNGTILNSPTKLTVASVVTPLVDATGALLLRSGGAGSLQFSSATGVVSSNSDNTTTLGSAALRWSAVFTPFIDSGTTGSLSLRTNGATQFIVDHTAGTVVNVLHATGGISGNPPFLQALGDANLGMRLIASGTGSIVFEAPGGTNQFVVLGTAGATRAITVTGSNGGNPTLSTTAGNLQIGTVLDLGTTGQIQFPAAQNPSAGVNVLDDYEEGTWTPSIGGTATYTTQAGTYTKIGRLVFVDAVLAINVIGTGGTVAIQGFPFTASSGACLNIEVNSNSATAIVSALLMMGTATTTATIRSRTAASAGDAQNAIFANGTIVQISGCYYTT